MKDPIIYAQDLCYQYEDSDHAAVNHVTLEIKRGEFLAVLGRNGSGKSTLAKLLNALLIPTSGTVEVDGLRAASEDDALPIRRVCGMVFQNPDNQIVSTLVEEDCAFGLENLGVEPKEIRRRVDETLKAVGMEDYAEASPAMLSGGQKQRVAVAGVLAMRPKIIVFDESTSMLDPIGKRDILALARQLNREEGITVVWITHFMEEATQADRLIIMDDGRIAMEGTPRALFVQTKKIHSLGLDVPEMMQLSSELRASGLSGLRADTMTVDEMVEELCRLKSEI